MFESLERMLMEYPWKINKKPKTTNMRKGQFSTNVGLTCHWAKPGKPMLPSKEMIDNNAEIYNECKMLFPEHEFDCIMINKNFECPPHKDVNNTGDSIIIGFGDYVGGNLNMTGESHDIYWTPMIFNGNEKLHWVAPWKGDRYSIVMCKSKFFSAG
jgi:hypothetical protein|tara:strand:+ start:471 stop:938 length:468 start_codon:yes stop_codon:yes gene_type:complete